MTYTVYIPDAERGSTSYTQRQFDSLKALARWVMDAALEEHVEKLNERLEPSEKLTAMAPPVVVLWEVDTDEWFTDASASEWAAPLRERDWSTLAKKYLAEIEQLFEFTITSKKYREALSQDDQWWFKQLAREHAPLFAENLFPETQVRWELLPVAFTEACANELTQGNNKKADNYVTPVHRFAKDAFTLLHFLRAGQRHASWKDVTPPAEEGLAWGSTAAEKTTEKLLTAWWSGAKPSDAVREFVLRVIVMRYFKQTTTTATTVGSAEFLTAYTECVRRVGAKGALPAGFLDWATRGTSFKHCKAALTSLGIASVRRADGQKYTNLEEIKDIVKETWVFEDSLADAYSESGMASYENWDTLTPTSTWGTPLAVKAIDGN